MKQLECMIAWTPATDIGFEGVYAETRGKVLVGPWPDRTGWHDGYSRTVGACFSDLHTMPEGMRLAVMFSDFHALVVRDGIDPQVAHEAFLAIDEYRGFIATDIPGADR